MKTCPKCRKNFYGSHHCSMTGRYVNGSEVSSADDGFAMSAAIGFATNNSLIGGIVGGNMLGGMVGDMLNTSADFSASTPEASPSCDSSSSVDTSYSSSGGDF